MQFETFCNRVKEELEAYYYGKGVEVTVKLHDVFRNNGVVWKGVCITEPGKKVSPNIYLNGYFELYENGTSFENVLERILYMQEKHSVEELNMDYFVNFDRVRDRIVYKLVHYEKNRELLKEIPHMRYLDMAVVFYYMLSDDMMVGASILLKQEHLNMWKVSKEDVFKAAAVNTPRLLGARIVSMKNIITEKCKELLERDPSKEDIVEEMMCDLSNMFDSDPQYMYVLSNETNLFGAACVLYRGVLKEFAEEIQSNLFVLPSSVHEMILIPEKHSDDPEWLVQMVREVNMTAIGQEEILSDHVYYYDRETDQMELCA